MKASSVSLCLLTATLFAGAAFGQTDSTAATAAPAPAATPAPAPVTAHGPRQRMLERFDANHDGKLDDAERATARAAWRQRTAEFRERHHDGHGRHHWRQMMRWRHAWREHRREAMLRRFDRDGDHRLSESERAAAREHFKQARERMQRGREQLLERFDANHDGKLDAGERDTMHHAWQKFLEQK